MSSQFILLPYPKDVHDLKLFNQKQDDEADHWWFLVDLYLKLLTIYDEQIRFSTGDNSSAARLIVKKSRLTETFAIAEVC